MRRTTIAVAVVAILASSCGGGEIPTRLAATLENRVATIRELAEDGRPGAARSALRGLVELVVSRLESGQIDEVRAMEILGAAQAVTDELAFLPRSSPSGAPSPSPTDEGDEGGGEGNHGEGEGKGKGKDEGKGNGGDGGHGND